jgi:hypothetical protein
LLEARVIRPQVLAVVAARVRDRAIIEI